MRYEKTSKGYRTTNVKAQRPSSPLQTSYLVTLITFPPLIIITTIIRSIAFLPPMRDQRLSDLIQFDKLAPDGVIKGQYRLMLLGAFYTLLGERRGSGR